MTTVQLKTAYVNEEAVIRKGRYADGSVALVADSTTTGERLSKLTVCMTDYDEKPRDDEHVFIKDYGENEGVYRALVDSGVVHECIRTLDAGFATDGVYECKLVDPDGIAQL